MLLWNYSMQQRVKYPTRLTFRCANIVCVVVVLMSLLLHALRRGLPIKSFLLLPLSLPSLLMSAGMASETTPYCAAYVTVPNLEVAKTIARGLVSQKLAACVNIIPGVTSVYEWEGKIEEDSELILMIKSRCSKTEELTDFVKKNHPYDVCEVITTPITGGNPAYLNWLGEVVKEKS